MPLEIIRIYHECKGRIRKSIQRITVWHHEICQVITNGDPEGWIFISHPHTSMFFFVFVFFIIYFFYFFNTTCKDQYKHKLLHITLVRKAFICLNKHY